MNLNPRLLATVAVLTGALRAFAQDESVKVETHTTIIDNLGSITREWWLGSLIATIALGLLVGFFVYRRGVENGRAGSATGTGCLASVIVFLIAQIVVVIVLISTIFSNAVQAAVEVRQSSKEKPAASVPTDSGATSGMETTQTQTPETTPPQTTPTAPPKPATTTGTTTGGDDF